MLLKLHTCCFYILSVDHASVDFKMSSLLPVGHALIDAYLRYPAVHTLPSWHIALDTIIMIAPYPTGLIKDVSSAHPDPAAQYTLGVAVPSTHPHVSFATGVLPANHPDIDTVLKIPAHFPLPSWHPPLSQFVNIGALVNSVSPSSRIASPW